MQTKQDPRELVLLMALRITLHAKLCLSVIIFLICVCWHPERICKALSSCLLSRGSVYTILSFDKCMPRSFGFMSLGFIARGYGLVASSATLSRSNFDCIWLALFPLLLCI